MTIQRRFKPPTSHFKASRTRGGAEHSTRVNSRSAWLKTRPEMVQEIVRLEAKLEGLTEYPIRYYWEALRLTNFRQVYKTKFGSIGRFRRLTKGLASLLLINPIFQ